jgi:hypothetical protein
MMSFFTTNGALDPLNQGRWNKNKEIPMNVAHLTQRLLLVLTISNLLGSRGHGLLLSSFIQCLASIILHFLDRGLPSPDDIFLIAMLHWQHGL